MRPLAAAISAFGLALAVAACDDVEQTAEEPLVPTEEQGELQTEEGIELEEGGVGEQEGTGIQEEEPVVPQE